MPIEVAMEKPGNSYPNYLNKEGYKWDRARALSLVSTSTRHAHIVIDKYPPKSELPVKNFPWCPVLQLAGFADTS